MAITHDTNYVYVTGTNDDEPFTLADIYQYDIDNGLGKIFYDGGKTYDFRGIGFYMSGVVKFNSVSENITFSVNPPGDLFRFYVAGGSEVMFDDVNFSGGGRRFRIHDHLQSMTFKNCKITAGSYAYLEEIKLTNCIFNKVRAFFIHSGVTFDSVTVINCAFGICPFNEFTAINDGLTIVNSDRSFYTKYISGDMTFSNIKSFNSGSVQVIIRYSGSTASLVDCNFNPASIDIDDLSNGNTIIKYKSTFIWNFAQQVYLKVYNAQDDLIIDKIVESGDEDILQFANRYIEIENFTVTTSELTYNEPFKLVASKEGYEPLTIPDIMITAGQPTNIRGELVPIEELNPVGFTNQAETEVLRHLFLNEDILNIGDTAGLLASSQEGNFYIALFTGDPGETGSTTSEATYTGYARASVSRGDTGWYEGMGIARNINPINFPECMGGEETITHYAIMKENTGDKMLCYGELQDPINIVKTSQPQFGPYSIEFRLN